MKTTRPGATRTLLQESFALQSARRRAKLGVWPEPTKPSNMATSYIPPKNTDFQSWLLNFSTLLTASPTTYGLVSGDATTVAAQYTAWHEAYLLVQNPSTKTSVTVAAMNAARATAEAIVRPYAVSISLNAGVTNDDKTAIGVTVKKTIPTPVPPPTTTVTLSLVSGAHLTHQLGYKDTSTPTAKAKPPGVIALQLFRAVGLTPATDPSQAVYYDVWTKSPNISTFQSADVGKVCSYFARWATRGGPGGSAQYGPWSAAFNVQIM